MTDARLSLVILISGIRHPTSVTWYLFLNVCPKNSRHTRLAAHRLA